MVPAAMVESTLVTFKYFLDCDKASCYKKISIHHLQPCKHLLTGLVIVASVTFISNMSVVGFYEEKLNIYFSSSMSFQFFTGENLGSSSSAISSGNAEFSPISRQFVHILRGG